MFLLSRILPDYKWRIKNQRGTMKIFLVAIFYRR